MSNHVALTDDERKDVVGFWADYFRNAGEGRQPTAFQLDAINDPDVRDAFLFWQIGANPTDFNPGFHQREKTLALTEVFGDNPSGKSTVMALTKLIKDNTDRGVEVEDIDTGSVWTLAHVMWLLLGGAWHWACDEAQLLAELAKKADEVIPGNEYPHKDPLYGLGTATAILSLTAVGHGDEKAMELSAQMYGLDENSASTQWARQNYAQVRADRLRKEAKNNAA